MPGGARKFSFVQFVNVDQVQVYQGAERGHFALAVFIELLVFIYLLQYFFYLAYSCLRGERGVRGVSLQFAAQLIEFWPLRVKFAYLLLATGQPAEIGGFLELGLPVVVPTIEQFVPREILVARCTS